MLSNEPVFCTRVDPFQEEVFLGLVPTLVVTSRWHSRKLGLPRAQVSHRKVLSGVSKWPSVHAHGVRRSIPAHSVYPQAGLGHFFHAIPMCCWCLLWGQIPYLHWALLDRSAWRCEKPPFRILLKMMNMGKCVFQLKEIYLRALGILFLWWDSSPWPEWKDSLLHWPYLQKEFCCLWKSWAEMPGGGAGVCCPQLTCILLKSESIEICP